MYKLNGHVVVENPEDASEYSRENHMHFVGSESYPAIAFMKKENLHYVVAYYEISDVLAMCEALGIDTISH